MTILIFLSNCAISKKNSRQQRVLRQQGLTDICSAYPILFSFSPGETAPDQLYFLTFTANNQWAFVTGLGVHYAPADRKAPNVRRPFYMNILHKIFGIKESQASTISGNLSVVETILAKEKVSNLWTLIQETLANYNSVSCQCAFPRFRQYTNIDCLEYHGTFHMSETEGFIYHSKPYFTIQKIDKGEESEKAIYTCNKCGSLYEYGWSDFSINLSRSYLKIIELNVEEIGSNIITPIPFYLGLFGYKYPDKLLFQQMDFENFKRYIQE